jgi:hypothetical protein
MNFNNDITLFSSMKEISIVNQSVFNNKGENIALFGENENVFEIFTKAGWKYLKERELSPGNTQIFLVNV